MEITMTARLAGIELGGTKCIAVLGTGPDAIDALVEVPTTTPGETLDRLRATLDHWQKETGFASIGIGSFGPLDVESGAIMATAKAGWTGAPVLTRLTDGFGVPSFIDTDVTGAALAEGRWGSAVDLDNYCYVTVGTGIGVGIIVQGKPIRGMAHPEAGHIRVSRVAGDHWPGSCPFHGDCVEGLASGSSIMSRSGGQAALLGPDDPIWDLVADALAQLLHTLASVVVPERVIMGGGVISARPGLLPRVRDRLGLSFAGYHRSLSTAKARERFVVTPALGRNAGPLGALGIALSGLEKSDGYIPDRT